MSEIQSSMSDLNNAKSLQEQREGKWTDRQNAAYIVFLQLNKNVFRRKQKRRVHKFYKKMSDLIKTRTPIQCRSHHQKLQSKYQYSNRIISYYKENKDLTVYEQQKLKFGCYSLQVSKKSEETQKPTQRNEISIQTEFQGTQLRFITAQEFWNLQKERKDGWNGANSWSYHYPYHYPPYLPTVCKVESQCKLQEEM